MMPKENDCETCIYDGGDMTLYPCSDCIKNSEKHEWIASPLYNAYLAEKARAERFRQALNCPECGGQGFICFDDSNNNIGFNCGQDVCLACAEIRKEAKEK